jgi:hypothetical protein
MTAPPLAAQMRAYSNGNGLELQAIDGGHMAVAFDDKGKMILPPAPAPTDIARLCLWLTVVFALDPQHPITGGERQGLAGPDGHVELRRTGAPSIRFEPMSKISQPQRLISETGRVADPNRRRGARIQGRPLPRDQPRHQDAHRDLRATNRRR